MHSEDAKTSGNGGDLGSHIRSLIATYRSAIRDAVIGLKAGRSSSVITVINPSTREMDGFRVVKVISRVPPGQRDLSDPGVRRLIRNVLKEERTTQQDASSLGATNSIAPGKIAADEQLPPTGHT